MPSVKKIETTVGHVRIVTGDGECVVQRLSDDETAVTGEVAVDEGFLLDAVLEYAHERGLRRGRKPKASAPAAKPRKPRQSKATAEQQQDDPFAGTPAALDA